jgi:hypothetical protein
LIVQNPRIGQPLNDFIVSLAREILLSLWPLRHLQDAFREIQQMLLYVFLILTNVDIHWYWEMKALGCDNGQSWESGPGDALLVSLLEEVL